MPRIRPTKFAHVVYRTRRFDEMLKWYETVFDTRVQYQNPGFAFLTYDDEHIALLLPTCRSSFRTVLKAIAGRNRC